jgi:hypothetical protein
MFHLSGLCQYYCGNMKKILLAISLITILASCENGNRVILTEDEYNQLVNKTNTKYPKQFELVGYDNFDGNGGILIGSDQHEYLVITSRRYSSETVVHYVDCELCALKKEDELARLIMDINLPKKPHEQQ